MNLLVFFLENFQNHKKICGLVVLISQFERIGFGVFFSSFWKISPLLIENLIVKTDSLQLVYEMLIAPYLWGKMITFALLTAMIQQSCCTDWYNSHDIFVINLVDAG